MDIRTQKNLRSTSGVLRCVLIVSLWIGMLLSYPLWLVENRIHPIIPASLGLTLPSLLHIGLVMLVVLCGVLILVSPRFRKTGYLAMVLVFAGLILLDVSRFQPWVYYYVVLLLALCLDPGSDKENGIRLIGLSLALIYIGSGWQKLNASFIYVTFPWLMEPFEAWLSPAFLTSYSPGWFAAGTELMGGIFMLFRRTQRAGCLILLMMHVFILASLGPTGRNFNGVVWPWNISFCILLLVLFLAKPGPLIQWNTSLTKNPVQWMYLLLLGFLPLLSIVDAWPKNASHTLYSGNKVRSTLFFSESMASSYPSDLQSKMNKQDLSIEMNEFALTTMRVPPYPSAWYHKQVFYALCSQSENEFDVVLTLYHEPPITSVTRTEETLFCSD